MLVRIASLLFICQSAASSTAKPEAHSAATCDGASSGSTLLQQTIASRLAKSGEASEADANSQIHKTSPKRERTLVLATASTARLAQTGYARLARLKNDLLMKTFIRRVIKKMGLIAVDEGPLNGLAPFYSGSKGFQSYTKLKKELQKIHTGPCSWLAPIDAGGEVFKKTKLALTDMGCSVELGESGYIKLAQRKNDAQMATFIHRVIRDMGLRVIAENSLNGIVPYYSGTWGTQSLEALRRELQKIRTGRCSWLIPIDQKIPLGIGRKASLNDNGYLSVAQTYNKMEMRDFVERVINDMNMEVVDENGLQGFLPYFNCEKDVKTYKDLKKELKAEAFNGTPYSWLTVSTQDHGIA